MPKPIVDVFILMSLFAPLLLSVYAAGEVFSAQAALPEMGWKWQAAIGASLALPVFALRRLRLLKTPTRPPSLME